MTASGALLVLAALVVAYLLGSIPSGVIVGRLIKGVDVRNSGSGRTGATNVLRTLGWPAAAAVTLMDVGKGVVAVLLGLALVDAPGQVAAGLAVVVGHNWSVFIGFRGGRGVMPAAGALLVLLPLSAVAGLALAVVVIASTRYVSLGSLVGTVTSASILAVYALLGPAPLIFAPLAIIGGGLIVFEHRDNIGRLMRGTERRLGERT
jgi:glycerol-3-phosphate acyltransferase PlsY